MTDMVIPPEAVEAAAKVLAPAMFREHTYVDPEPMRDMHRATARAALEAALHHLRPTACTCPTDADVTPDMRDETGQHLSGCPSGAKGLAAWMDEQIERIDETKALVETAAKLGRELGRREAAEVIAARIDLEAARARSRHAPHTADGYANAAQLAREIATKEPTDEPEASQTRCSHCGFYRPSGGGLEHHPKCPHAATKEPK